MTGAAQDLTAATFDEEVLGASVPVVVDFWAEWCGPCHALAPILDEIAAEHADTLRIYKLDIDAWPESALRFDVMSFPTLLVFQDGQVVKRLIGARGKRHLLAELADVLGEAAGVRRRAS
jgi:thioredoxin 1